MATSRGPEPAFDFTVEADGTLQFDPSLDSLIVGRGTRDMVLHGTQVEIDVSELSYSRFNLAGITSFTATNEPMPFVLMPGGHGLTMTTSRGPEPGFDFTVEADGTLQFDPSLDTLIGGRGTRDMVLRGTQVNIDFSELSYIQFTLAGAGSFTTTTTNEPVSVTYTQLTLPNTQKE